MSYRACTAQPRCLERSCSLATACSPAAPRHAGRLCCLLARNYCHCPANTCRPVKGIPCTGMNCCLRADTCLHAEALKRIKLKRASAPKRGTAHPGEYSTAEIHLNQRLDFMKNTLLRLSKFLGLMRTWQRCAMQRGVSAAAQSPKGPDPLMRPEHPAQKR